MQDPRWPAFEFAFQAYLKEQFLDSSLKRANEFETIWNGAFQEGGKWHLNNFIHKLENEAQNLDD